MAKFRRLNSRDRVRAGKIHQKRVGLVKVQVLVGENSTEDVTFVEKGVLWEQFRRDH